MSLKDVAAVADMVTYRSWWPASVVLPDKSVAHRVKVYATNAALVIYRSVPADGVAADWSSPIDFTATAVPAASQLPGQSFSVTTAAGLVVITYTGGCGCGNPLKRWRPEFSTRTAAWPVTP